MIEYIPVVCQFRLMQHAFIDKTVPFEHLLRPLVVRVAIGGDEAELQFVEPVIEYSLHRFCHISFAPIRFVKPVSQHTHLRIFPLQVGDDSDGTDKQLRVFQCHCPNILLADKHILKNLPRFLYRLMWRPSCIIT